MTQPDSDLLRWDDSMMEQISGFPHTARRPDNRGFPHFPQASEKWTSLSPGPHLHMSLRRLTWTHHVPVHPTLLLRGRATPRSKAQNLGAAPFPPPFCARQVPQLCFINISPLGAWFPEPRCAPTRPPNGSPRTIRRPPK